MSHKDLWKPSCATKVAQSNFRGMLAADFHPLSFFLAYSSPALLRLSTRYNTSPAPLTQTLVDEGSHSDGGEGQTLQNRREL
jgi:hypothetical protein